MKLAAVQYRPPKGRPDVARDRLAAWVAEAGARGAELIVCPEMATTGYVWPDAAALAPHAEAADGPTFQALSAVARRYRAWVVCGYPERAPEGLYNAALVIGPDGGLVVSYRKVLLYEADHTWAIPGQRRVLVSAPGLGRISPSICMDLNDPGHTWHLALHRPEVVAFCTNWIDEGQDILPYWRERLGPWRGWFVAADTWGVEEGVRFYGRSTILSPAGEPVLMAEAEGDALLLVDTEDQSASVAIRKTVAPTPAVA